MPAPNALTPNLLCAVLMGRGPTPDSADAWMQLLSQARRANLAARLAGVVAASNLDVPYTVRWQLDGACKAQQHMTRLMRLEIRRVVGALRSEDLEPVLLKGAAYLASDLPPATSRHFGDIDVLVLKSDLASAEAALMGGGWINLDALPYDQRYYREWMHEIPPLTHITRGSVIDLHHTIVPPTSVLRVEGAELLAKSIRSEHRPGIRILQPEDMVLHNMVHLFTDGEFDNGLRDLLDLWDLLRHFSRLDGHFFDTLLARSKDLGLSRPLYHALHHLERLSGPMVPVHLAALRDEGRPSLPARLLMHWILSVGLRPQHPSCHRLGDGLARWMLYVRAHWLRMPLRLLVPHLIRKAWLQRFPPPASKSGTAA